MCTLNLNAKKLKQVLRKIVKILTGKKAFHCESFFLRGLFRSEVIDLSSHLKVKIFDNKPANGNAEAEPPEEMGFVRVELTEFDDQKQRKQWHDLIGPRKGQVRTFFSNFKFKILGFDTSKI